jgi:hypothetical protein
MNSRDSALLRDLIRHRARIRTVSRNGVRLNELVVDGKMLRRYPLGSPPKLIHASTIHRLIAQNALTIVERVSSPDGVEIIETWKPVLPAKSQILKPKKRALPCHSSPPTP